MQIISYTINGSEVFLIFIIVANILVLAIDDISWMIRRNIMIFAILSIFLSIESLSHDDLILSEKHGTAVIYGSKSVVGCDEKTVKIVENEEFEDGPITCSEATKNSIFRKIFHPYIMITQNQTKEKR